MAKKGKGTSRASGKISALRLLHLLPGVGVALIGDGASLPGAVTTLQSGIAANPSNPGLAFGKAGQTFTDEIAIAYLGYQPSTGANYFAQGYPYRTYAAHFAIEVTRFLVKKFVRGKRWSVGPLSFP
jgi:hypothetical protein